MWGIPMFDEFFRIKTIVGNLPVSLQNGQTADASQVMSDLNFIVNQVNANAADVSLVALLAGNNAFVGNQTITGTLGVSGPISASNAVSMRGGRAAGSIAASANADITATGAASNQGFVVVQGQDGLNNQFTDLIVYRFFGLAPQTIIKADTLGAPATRTYTIGGGSGELNLAMGVGGGPYAIRTLTFLPNA